MSNYAELIKYLGLLTKTMNFSGCVVLRNWMISE
jgi:hypothetical protein